MGSASGSVPRSSARALAKRAPNNSVAAAAVAVDAGHAARVLAVRRGEQVTDASCDYVNRWHPDGYVEVLVADREERVRAEPFDAVELPIAVLFGEDED